MPTPIVGGAGVVLPAKETIVKQPENLAKLIIALREALVEPEEDELVEPMAVETSPVPAEDTDA
eukprot:scaffold1328_cov394-Prasinococcus_capsulatus_cf.AAC.41